MGKEKKGRQYQDTIFRKYFNDEKRLKEMRSPASCMEDRMQKSR